MQRRQLIHTWIQVFFSIAILQAGCQPAVQTPAVAENLAHGVSALKLVVDQAGLYRLNAHDLRISGMTAVDPAQIRIEMGGEKIPIWLEESPDDFSVMFYGALPDSQYSRQNIYWLRLDAQEVDDPLYIESRMIGDLPVSISNSYLARLVLEEKLVFSPLIPDDPWYWVALHAPNEQIINIELGDVNPGSAVLKIKVWGATQAPTSYDHHLRVLINENLVLDEWWDGSGSKQLETEIAGGILKRGQNRIMLETPGDTGAIADSIYLGRIELTYPRRDPGIDDRLFLIGEEKVVVLKGLHAPVEVFDVTETSQPVRLIGSEESQEEVRFLAEDGRQYLAIGELGYLTPNIEIPVDVPNIFQSSLGAEYLVVGPAALLAPLTPLMELRQEQGITSLLLPVEAVYDQFNTGYPEPDAIHDLVLHAVANWEIKPKYLLLVGDATYDPKGYQAGPVGNQLPIYFVNTQYGGLTGTDLPYVDVDGDEKPDLAVGRVPARTSEEVQNWVEKTIAYERTLKSDIPLRALAVADGQEISFRNDAQLFLDHLASGYQGDLFAPDPGAQDAKKEILGFFESGYHLIGYFGHGSLDMWGRDRLLTTKDIQGLENENLPIVLTMTCLNGFFIHPTNTSLAESLLFLPNGGAVAVLAPTSLTLVWDQMSLGSNLYQGLAVPGDKRLGDVLLDAQQLMPQDSHGQRDVLLTFLLFGDPALRLR